jgi:hypothetical protein
MRHKLVPGNLFWRDLRGGQRPRCVAGRVQIDSLPQRNWSEMRSIFEVLSITFAMHILDHPGHSKAIFQVKHTVLRHRKLRLEMDQSEVVTLG